MTTTIDAIREVNKSITSFEEFADSDTDSQHDILHLISSMSEDTAKWMVFHLLLLDEEAVDILIQSTMLRLPAMTEFKHGHSESAWMIGELFLRINFEDDSAEGELKQVMVDFLKERDKFKDACSRESEVESYQRYLRDKWIEIGKKSL